MIEYAAIYLVLINLAGFALMGMDKSRAKRGRRRISERSLFMAALAGGSLGAALGMRAFRHKTKRRRFKYGLPGLLLVQAALALYLYASGRLAP